MNIALRKSMTLQEFPAWESRQELRYEFDGFQPVAMNGVSSEHAFIESSLKGPPEGQAVPRLRQWSQDRGRRAHPLP